MVKQAIKTDEKTEAEALRQKRRKRFRILVCIDGTEESYAGARYARQFADDKLCDIVLLYVRQVDQGLSSGGLQMRVARQNLLDWGLELPGITYLRKALDILTEESQFRGKWKERIEHADVFGDPLGDNKVEFVSPGGRRSIVLKLKTAPDISGGILHQTELGPYNLVIMGPPERWSTGVSYYLNANTVQKVARLAPGAVMTVRNTEKGRGYLLTFDGTDRARKHMIRAAYLAHFLGEPINLLAVLDSEAGRSAAEQELDEVSATLIDDDLKIESKSAVVGNRLETILAQGNQCSAIVVSDAGTSRTTKFFRHSVAFDIMGKATTSVLNVH